MDSEILIVTRIDLSYRKVSYKGTIIKIKIGMTAIEREIVFIYENSIINELFHISNQIEEENKRNYENIVDFEFKKKVHYREIEYGELSRKYLYRTTRKIIDFLFINY